MKHNRTMNKSKAASLLLLYSALSYNDGTSSSSSFVHSFHLQGNPSRVMKHFKLPSRCNMVGARYPPIDPQNWSDIEPHDEMKLSSSTATRQLNAIESLHTKYGLIAYVAHMCTFLPLSLIPTL